MIRFILLLLVMLSTTSVYAVRVTSIYQAKVPVPSQSAEDRAKVLTQALAQVIVKVSGNNQVLENPNIKLHLKDATVLLQEFGYSTSNNALNPYILEIRFDSENINKLLRDSAVPIWGTNRPLILGWIECEEPNHPTEIIDATSSSDIQSSIKTYADQRGIPIILPMMDMTDLNLITANDIVTMDVSKLQNAAGRYASDAILIARVLQVSNDFSLQAKLVMGTDQWQWNITGKSRVAVVKSLMDKIADTLAGRYATVVTKTIQENVMLKVAGVSEQDDFAQMLHYVQHLPQVASVQVAQITGDDVFLNISLRGARDSFTKILSVGKKMTPLSFDPNGKSLAYQWNR